MRWTLICLMLLSACSWKPRTYSYREQYAYLQEELPLPVEPSDPYYMVVLVNARRLDYSDQGSLIKTINKHPVDASKRGDIGHAWFLLHGKGETIEAGHASKEEDPGYFEQFMESQNNGHPNPIHHFWADRFDGLYHTGARGHSPTLAALIPLTQQQWRNIRAFVDPHIYDYRRYNIVEHQCTTLVTSAAKMAGVQLDAWVTVDIAPDIYILFKKLRMWKDPYYSKLRFANPDRLEAALYGAIKAGKATNVTDWYRKQESAWLDVERVIEATTLFPLRFSRFLILNPEE